MFKRNILLILIIIAVFLRYVALEFAPPHLSNDEIGASYAAYSISKTMRDATGQFLPLLWQSHGGYGSPLAIYIPLITINVFGNTDFAVRLPSAILGSLTVLFVGLLIRELTKNDKLALVGAFILAFSPWHFTASRWALESNYALFFITVGLFLFFRSLRSGNTLTAVLSSIFLTLSIYSYYTEWVLTPLLILGLAIFYWKNVKTNKKYFVSALIFIILLIPLAFSYFRNPSASRASSEFITKDVAVGRLLSEHESRFVKMQIVTKAVMDKYSNYSSLEYLFFDGAKILPKENPYQFGFILTTFVIAFVFGLFKLKDFYKENTAFVYYLLAVTPLVASVTQGEINNWRSLPQLLPLVLITSSGVLELYRHISNNFYIKFAIYFSLFISIIYFSVTYFMHFPIEKAVGYQYGYKQIAFYINDNYNSFTKIIIDRRFGDKNYYFIGVPSSYIPFYTYLDPKKVQDSIALINGISFDKYEFRDISWDNEEISKDYLYIVPFDILPAENLNLRMIYQVNLPNNQPAFRFYTSKDGSG